MINLSGNALMLIRSDGSQVAFDVEKLQSGIIRSCLSAGVRDVWIAEDISLAVEYALSLPANRERTFTVSDVNSIIIRILEETGYPAAAEEYRRHNSSIGVKVNPEYSLISDLIARHLGLSGQNLAEVSSLVVDAAEMLNLAEASPTLFVELAKFYKDRLMSDDNVDLVKLPEAAANPWQLSREQIIEHLPEATQKYIDEKILDISGISQLFPALKLDFRITRLIKYLGLESPLTEMAVISHFHDIADAMNNIITTTEQMRKEKNIAVETEILPVYLNVGDMSRFACRNLFSVWPDAEPQCREMISYLQEMLCTRLFKVSFK